MQVYQTTPIEAATTFSSVANTARFSQIYSIDTFVLDQALSFIAPVEPSAGKSFTITVGGHIVQPVQMAAIYLNCNLNDKAGLALNSDYLFDIPVGPFSYTFSIPAAEAKQGVWSCADEFVHWKDRINYVAWVNVDFTLQ